LFPSSHVAAGLGEAETATERSRTCFSTESSSDVALQALSNGQYRSVWHRAVVNSDRERMSVASFLCPCNHVVLGPARKLVTEDTPAVYRNYTYDEYYAKFWSRNLDQEHCLELFRT
jgi:salicylic acid 3-hydroxylase